MKVEKITNKPLLHILIALLGRLYVAGLGLGKVNWSWCIPHIIRACGKIMFSASFCVRKVWKVSFGRADYPGKNKPPPRPGYLPLAILLV